MEVNRPIKRTCSQHRHIHLCNSWFEIFSTFAYLDIQPAQLQPLSLLIRPIHHGKDESRLGKDCQGDEKRTILSEGHRPAC